MAAKTGMSPRESLAGGAEARLTREWMVELPNGPLCQHASEGAQKA